MHIKVGVGRAAAAARNVVAGSGGEVEGSDVSVLGFH